MAADFSRTLLALRPDRGRNAVLSLICALLLLTGWTTWLCLVRVAVYRTSTRARLEVSTGPTRISSAVLGRVIRSNLTLGAHVRAGEILLELDAAVEQFALTRARGQLAAVEAELALLSRELDAELDAAHSEGAADRAALRETAARERAAEAALVLAEEEEQRARVLVSGSGVAPAALSRATGDLRQKRASHDAVSHEGATLDGDRRERAADRRARRERLERQRVELEARRNALRVDIAHLTHEVERRAVRSPIAGTLGDVATFRPGAVISTGDVLATVVPDGGLQLVATYDPDALGRIAVGQHAQVRLDSFPWTHYGTLSARVSRVGNELRDGAFRVELSVAPSARIPLRHGMIGAVDIEIERASPLALLVRAIGRQSDALERP